MAVRPSETQQRLTATFLLMQTLSVQSAGMAESTTLPVSPLESLPLILLESICEELVSIDDDRRSLFAFSMASKRCCAVAAMERFKRVHLAVEGAEQLERVLKRWDDILSIDDRTRSVRRVKVTGSMEGKPKNDPEECSWIFGCEDDLEKGRYDEEDAFSAPGSLRQFLGGYPIITPERKVRSNRNWRLLAQFLSRLPALKQVIWGSKDQIPRCVLDVLHSSNTHLQVNTFGLRSLHQRRDQLQDIDADEYALVTSPSITSISAATSYCDSLGRMDYTIEALMEMVRLAPNLRSVSLWGQPLYGDLGVDEAIRQGRVPWQGFFKAEKKPRPEPPRPPHKAGFERYQHRLSRTHAGMV
jgi:hypothetical protein